MIRWMTPPPLDTWLGVGFPTSHPYPCPCGEEFHYEGPPKHPKDCPCVGRTDLAGLSSSCCAVRKARPGGWR